MDVYIHVNLCESSKKIRMKLVMEKYFDCHSWTIEKNAMCKRKRVISIFHIYACMVWRMKWGYIIRKEEVSKER